MFDVWLDTNIVLRWNLRLDTAEARKFFKYAEDFHLRIFISEVVLRELVQHYVRRAMEHLQKQATIRDVLADLDLPGAHESLVHAPADLDTRCSNVLTQRCAASSITIVPLGSVPMDRLLDMAVKRIPPFQEKQERGFRDALILFSILVYAKEHKQPKAVLISADKIFNDERIGTLASEYVLSLEVFDAVDSFTAYLESLETKAKQRMRELQARRVRAFLLDHKNEIQDFIGENTQFDENFLSGGLLVGQIRRIISIGIKDITRVTTISAESAKKAVTRLLITFGVLLDIELEIDRLWGTQEPQRYRVGEEVEQVLHSFVSPRREITRVEREVRCEATAEQRGNKFGNLQLKEVKIGPFGFGALRPPAFGQGPPPPGTP